MASELYNNSLGIYYDEYNELSDNERNKIVLNINLRNYFWKNLIMIAGLKMQNRLIQQEKVIKKNRLMKNLLIHHQCHYQKVMKKEKKEKDSKS